MSTTESESRGLKAKQRGAIGAPRLPHTPPLPRLLPPNVFIWLCTPKISDG